MKKIILQSTDAVQVSPGVLSKPEQQDQVSLGDKKSQTLFPLVTTQESIADLAIKQIHQINSIPDYKGNTAAKHPIVAQTPKGYFCLDGWELITSAQTRGQSSITCHVHSINGHSDMELAIQKTAIRSFPQGGAALYPELMANVWLLFNRLKSSNDNLVMYLHGGCRRGDEFENNRDENIRVLLAVRLGKGKSTISNYIAHARFLDDYILNFLIENRAPKKFFVEAQRKKNVLIKSEAELEKTFEEITAIVSTNYEQMYVEFRANGTIKRSNNLNDTQGNTPTPKDEPKKSCILFKPDTFRHYTGPAGKQLKLPTENELRVELSTKTKKIEESIEKLQLSDLVENIKLYTTFLLQTVEIVEWLSKHPVQSQQQEVS